jgi:hypothetical protein
MEDEAAVVEEETEKITEPVEEYTETASIPKDHDERDNRRQQREYCKQSSKQYYSF